MNSKKMESAKDFLKSLEDPNVTIHVMSDRMDSDILNVITNYSRLIHKIKSKTSVQEKDLLACSMILGYLLKGHVDRYELDENIKKRQ